MPLQINIPDDDMKHLLPPARLELEANIKKFTVELLIEASRLEAASKTTVGNPEITSSMVKDANTLLRRGYKKPKKDWWLVVFQVISAITILITGLLADFDKLKEPATLIMFIVILSIALISTVVVLIKE